MGEYLDGVFPDNHPNTLAPPDAEEIRERLRALFRDDPRVELRDVRWWNGSVCELVFVSRWRDAEGRQYYQTIISDDRSALDDPPTIEALGWCVDMLMVKSCRGAESEG